MNKDRGKALKLYCSGNSKEYICKTFSIDIDKLDNWIRKEALLMYIYGKSKPGVCKKFNVHMEVLDKWINEMNRPKKRKTKIKHKTAMRIPKGYSTWVSDICKNARDAELSDCQTILNQIEKVCKNARSTTK